MVNRKIEKRDKTKERREKTKEKNEGGVFLLICILPAHYILFKIDAILKLFHTFMVTKSDDLNKIFIVLNLSLDLPQYAHRCSHNIFNHCCNWW